MENDSTNIVSTLSNAMLASAIVVAMKADDNELDEMIKAARTILGTPTTARRPFEQED